MYLPMNLRLTRKVRLSSIRSDYVHFVSWAYLDTAEAAESARSEWEKSLSKKKDVELAKRITQDSCLPEYHGYLQALADAGDSLAKVTTL